MRTLSQGVTYKHAHVRVRIAKGKAAAHECRCGQQGKFWAYQHTDPQALHDDKGRPYSMDPEHYAPMCARCHRQFDIDHDQRVGAAARANGQVRGLANKARLKSDPEYAARMKAQSQAAVKKVQRQRRRCSTCGMVSTPFGLGRHLSASGHQGYTDLEEQ